MTREKAREILNNYNDIMSSLKDLITEYANGANIEMYTDGVWRHQDFPSFLLNLSYRIEAKSEKPTSELDIERFRLLGIKWVYSEANEAYVIVDLIGQHGIRASIGYISYEDLVKNYKMYDDNLNEVKI